MGAPYALSSDLVSAWPAKSLEVAQYIDGQLPLIAMTQNAQTGTTYTLAATDFTKLVTLSNASPVTVTVPLESSVAWVAGTQLRLMNLGAGVVTVAGAVGVTINGNPLTLAQYKEGTLTKTGTNTWTFVGSPAAPGMDLITPTSVAGSGVTVSGGQVSFSAATEVDVNGCFTSAYDNYLLVIRYSSSGNAYVDQRLRASGSNVATSTYAWTLGAVSTSVVAAEVGSASATSIRANYSGTGKHAALNVVMMSPALAEQTLTINDSSTFGSEIYRYYGNGLNTNATSYDGFALIPSTGNITGKLRVYGLRNS